MVETPPREPDPPSGVPPASGPPASGPPASGWTIPDGAAPDRPPSRAMLVLSWVTALVIAGFGAWVALRVADGSDSYRAGYATGTVVAPFILAAIVRLIVVRLRGGRFGLAALRSPWVPLGGALLVGIAAAANIAALAPPRPVDAATAMHVSAPYTLQEADQATVDQVTRALRENGEIAGSIALRHVVGEDGSTSLLVAADARLEDGDLAEVMAGMQDSSGVAPTVESIAGQEVAVMTTPDAVIATWVDAPLLISVYAVDLSIVRAVVEAVIASG